MNSLVPTALDIEALTGTLRWVKMSQMRLGGRQQLC